MSDLGVTGIRVSFGGTVALDDVSIDVPAGEVTAVVGGDGAGKSTVLRVLAGRAAPQRGHVRTVAGRDIGYQPATSGVWGSLTVAENLAFVGQAFRMPRRAIRARGDALLERAGLAAARDRLGRELSGGMRQKLGLVLAIMHEPRLVLLDEPSTGVDPVSRVELWRLIAETAAGGTAVIMATTYLDEAARATSVTALDGGRMIASGAPDEIIASVPGRVVVAAPTPVFCGGITAQRSARRDVQPLPTFSWSRGTARHRWVPPGGAAAEGDPVPIDLEDALIALTFARDVDAGDAGATGSPSPTASVTERLAEPGTVVASGQHITRRFGNHVAVDDVSLEVATGEIVGLLGANGAGKTTFLRTLIGLDAPSGGEALMFGAPPSAASRARLGYVPQGLGLYQNISVARNAEFFARVYRMPEPQLAPSLAEVAHDAVGSIGLGRQRQLAFALALAHAPELLVLDEPTSGVDPLSRARLWDTIHAQADAGVGVIVTTHYLQEAEQCTRLVLLSQGRIVGVGSVAELTAGVAAVIVRARDWQGAFAALSVAGLPTMLAGRAVRIAGVTVDEVRAVIAAAVPPIVASIDEAAPTLEEAMILRER